jgi:hypothetical protein
MLKFEVKETEVDVKQGVSGKTGKPYVIREQVAWGFFCDQHGKPHPYPIRTRLMLEDSQEPYQPGIYTLAPESFYPDRFGQVAVRAKLKPVVEAVKRAA